MKKHMKKALALVLALMMIMSLAACGGTTFQPTETPSEPTETQTPEAESGELSWASGATTDPSNEYYWDPTQYTINTDNLTPMNVIITHCDAEDMNDGMHASAVRLAEALEYLSGGKVTGTVYPNAQLGDERSTVEQVQNGTIDIALCTTAVGSNFSQLCTVTDLPYLFKDSAQARKVASSEIGDKIRASFEPAGLKVINYTENGFRYFLTTKEQIAKVEDLKGLKFRCMQSNVYVGFYEGAKASAVPMAYGEVYTALSQGTIDGFDLTLPLILSGKFDEICKFITDGRYTYTNFLVNMNLNKWNSYNEDMQTLFWAASEAARLFSYETNDRVAEFGVQQLISDGVTFTEASTLDFDAFQAISTPVWDSYRKDVDGLSEVLDEILAMNG